MHNDCLIAIDYIQSHYISLGNPQVLGTIDLGIFPGKPPTRPPRYYRFRIFPGKPPPTHDYLY